MQDKLQQLTDKLYNEGLAKGKEEAERLLSNAKSEAEKIIANAKEESEKMIAQAEKECANLKQKAEGDIKTASFQALTQIKQDIEEAIKAKTVTAPISEALSSGEFLQSLIKSVVEAFKPSSQATSLEVILPEQKRKEMEQFFSNAAGKALSEGVNISFSKDVANGFKVSSKGSGYFIDFTGNSFEKIISQYIRPKTRKLLFGE